MKLFRKNHDRIRAVMTDINGTLVDIESAAIPDEAVSALKKLRKKGIKTYICTGRNRAEIDSGIRSIGWDGMVLINGRLALDENGEVIWNQPIRADQISGLLEMIRTDYFPVCFVCADQIFLNNRDGSVEQLGVEPSLEEGQMDPRIASFDEIDGLDVYSLAVYAGSERDESFKALFDCTNIERLTEGVLSVDPDYNGKIDGARALLKNDSIPRTALLYLGDGEHDLRMIEYSGFSAAMPESPENVRQAADYVTDKPAQGGFVNALRHFKI